MHFYVYSAYLKICSSFLSAYFSLLSFYAVKKILPYKDEYTLVSNILHIVLEVANMLFIQVGAKFKSIILLAYLIEYWMHLLNKSAQQVKCYYYYYYYCYSMREIFERSLSNKCIPVNCIGFKSSDEERTRSLAFLQMIKMLYMQGNQQYHQNTSSNSKSKLKKMQTKIKTDTREKLINAFTSIKENTTATNITDYSRITSKKYLQNILEKGTITNMYRKIKSQSINDNNEKEIKRVNFRWEIKQKNRGLIFKK